MHKPTPLLTFNLAEASEATGMTIRTLRNLVATRRVPFVRVGRSIRFRAADLEQWLADNTEASRS